MIIVRYPNDECEVYWDGMQMADFDTLCEAQAAFPSAEVKFCNSGNAYRDK